MAQEVEVAFWLAILINDSSISIHFKGAIIRSHTFTLSHAWFVCKTSGWTLKAVEFGIGARFLIVTSHIAFVAAVNKTSAERFAISTVWAVITSGNMVIVDVAVFSRWTQTHNLMLAVKSRLTSKVPNGTAIVAFVSSNFSTITVASCDVVTVIVIASFLTSSQCPIQVII